MNEVGESLRPPVAAVIVFLVLNVTVRVTIPMEGVFRAPWLTPLLEAALLVALVTADPTSAADRRRRRGGGRSSSTTCTSASRTRPRSARPT
jgi:hypothetical protein